MELDWKALYTARERGLRRVAEQRAAEERWRKVVRDIAEALGRAGYGTERLIETGGRWPVQFTATAPGGGQVTVHVTPGPRDVQDLVAQEIRDCRVRVAEDLIARFCKADEPVPATVADWASTHGVSPEDCPRCRAEPQQF